MDRITAQPEKTGISFPSSDERTRGDEFHGFGKEILSQPVQLESLLTKLSEMMKSDEFFKLVISIGDFFKQRGDLTAAEAMYTLGLTHGGQNLQPDHLAEALIRRGDVYSCQGRWKDANIDLDEGRKICVQLNEPVSISRVENILGLNYAVRGKMKRAKAYVKRALQSFEQSEETLLSGIAQMNLGVIFTLLNDYDRALICYNRARSCFETAGDLVRLAQLHHKIGMVFLAKGAHPDASCEFDLAASLSLKSDNAKLNALAKVGKANVFYELGDLKAALGLANQSLAAFSIHDDRLCCADVYLLKGKIYRGLRRFEFAEWYFQTSLKIHRTLESQFNVAECYRELGVLQKCRENPGEARHAFEKSLHYFKSIGAVHDVNRVTTELRSVRGKTEDEARGSRRQ